MASDYTSGGLRCNSANYIKKGSPNRKWMKNWNEIKTLCSIILWLRLERSMNNCSLTRPEEVLILKIYYSFLNCLTLPIHLKLKSYKYIKVDLGRIGTVWICCFSSYNFVSITHNSKLVGPMAEGFVWICFHYSIIWFLSDKLWKLKTHFRCF